MNTARRRMLGLLAALCATPACAADTIGVGAAPQRWVAYSMLLGNMVHAWLSDNTDAAMRLNAYLDAMRDAPGSDNHSVPLAVWIGKTGVITRIEFPPFAHPQANADMTAVLVNRELPEAPPPDMRQPVLLNLNLAKDGASG